MFCSSCLLQINLLFFLRHVGIFLEYHNGTGLGGTACAWQVKNDFVCVTGWCLCKSLIPEVHISLGTRCTHMRHISLLLPSPFSQQGLSTGSETCLGPSCTSLSMLENRPLETDSLQGSFFCVKFHDCTTVADSSFQIAILAHLHSP